MLDYLRIRNLALIADMELEFAPGMNVLTGETGAGKSFILKAINFLLGERMGVEMVRPGQEKALVEALFVQPEGELALRRELNGATGRSRIYINGNIGSQEAVRELRSTLIIHTGQHGQQRLLQPSFQAALIDGLLVRRDLLKERDTLLKGIRNAIARRDALKTRFKELAEQRELLELHLAEIDRVAPQPGEEERLEEIRNSLRESEQLRIRYESIQRLLHGEDTGLFDQLGQLEQLLGGIATINGEAAQALEATISFRQTVKEFARSLRSPALPVSNMDSEQLEARLYELARLKRKLHRTLPEILALRAEIAENLSLLDTCALDIHQIEKEQTALQDQLAALLVQLNPLRHEAAEKFAAKLEAELSSLGFSKYLRVITNFTPHEYFPGCAEDRVRLLWAPNPGQPARALDEIASGGELSRFMLAVTTMQRTHEETTLVFDEVDAGVGGITLNKVAEKLSALAEHRQVLLITHWPQLANRAARHFQVAKYVHDGETFTSCFPLEGAAKEAELARMAGIEQDIATASLSSGPDMS